LSLNKIKKGVLVLIIFVLGFGIGQRFNTQNIKSNFSFGRIVNQGSSTINQDVDFQEFWTVWDKVSTRFVDREKIQPRKMMEGAISGMIATLGDPYTVYLPKAANDSSKEDLRGSFEGIGAQLGLLGKKIIVIAPLSETPAEKAGVKSGDQIYKVNGEVMDGKSLPEVVSKIRGPKGTKVDLVLKRTKSKDLALNITRDTIVVKSVTLEFLKQKDGQEIADIKLSRFGEKTNDEWLTAISKISEKGNKITGVILDVRNNPGGFLDSSVFVASEFLPQSTKIVTQASSIEGEKIYYSNRQGKLLNGKVVVLINKGSASASEIVAGALKDNNRAKLVGEKSFGKGSVQEAEDLAGGSGLHITIAKWITPSGIWIHGKGIEPDFVVKNDDKKPKEDAQLKKAIEILTN
jgi:carboxyl-terminal processing protease